MQNLWNSFVVFISNNFNAKSFMLIFEIGILLILLAIFLPQKIVMYKVDLKKMLNQRVTDVRMSSLVKYLHALSRKGIFRFFILKDNSDSYVKLDNMIIKAGGLRGCTPDIIHFFKIIIPTVVFSVITSIYLISVKFGGSNDAASIINENVKNTTSGIIIQKVAGQNSISIFTIIIILIFSSLFYFLPEFALNRYIKSREKKLLNELTVIETFISIYIEAGFNVYDIMFALQDVVVYSKKYTIECCNEFYTNPEKAIQNYSDKIALPEYQLVCDILKSAINNSGEYAASFITQHMDQLNKLKDLAYQAKNKTRPLLYVFILAIPMLSIVLIWFYPWIEKVMKMINFTNI